MPCHPKALARYAEAITRCPADADRWLDEWIDATTRASEWDADQWGFDPTRWMADERAQLLARADGATWPTEPDPRRAQQ